MFQYAAGRALAKHHSVAHKLDTSWYNNTEQMQTHRNYELSVFNLPESIAGSAEVDRLLHKDGSLSSRIVHYLDRRRPYYKKLAFLENQFHFDSNFFKSRSSVLLIGYWQSQRYFLPIADEIRQLFTVTHQLQGENLEWANRMRNSNSVSLHVRRGDMVHNPEVAKVHGSCSLDYYTSAAKKIADEVGAPEFFIFSDDPEWCSTHLNIGYPTYIVDNNLGNQAYLDMQLMCLCKHNIIANSSFSWWGAWLNKNPGKRVIAPRQWFNDNTKNVSDLIPAEWQLL